MGSTPASDFVRNGEDCCGDGLKTYREASASRYCTESSAGRRPRFFIGCSPSQASTILSPDYPAAGVMVSVNQLRRRKSPFPVRDWLMDSGAFTEIATYGFYRESVEHYYQQIVRWSCCGNLIRAIAQDFMCEPFILERTGLSVAEHQRLTVERYDQLLYRVENNNEPCPKIMPVLQGYRTSDYLAHLGQYGSRLREGMWVGVGSVCRRNGKPDEVADLLRAIKLVRPDLRLHGFGLKQTALENSEVRLLLYSCDSMAWSVPRKFGDPTPELELAHSYQEKVAAVGDSVRKRVPRTAGAGNGQGRKPKWKSGKTKAIRVPEKFAERLMEMARQWDEEE